MVTEDWCDMGGADENQELIRTAEELATSGGLSAAHDIAKRIVSEDPTNADAWNVLGCISHALGALDLAEELFRRSSSLDPASVDIRMNLVEVLRIAGRTDEALSVCEAGLKLCSDERLTTAISELTASSDTTPAVDAQPAPPVPADDRRASESATIRRVVAWADARDTCSETLAPASDMLRQIPSIADEPRGVHFGAYWMGENDVVRLMALDLEELCAMRTVDTRIYDSTPSDWFEPDYRYYERNPVKWLDHERVLDEVRDHRANFVVVNSGGMSLRPETIESLRRDGVICIGISLSDPDVFPYHGSVYAHLYDLYYTNSMYSIQHQYGDGVRAGLIPFAASTRLHRPLADVPKEYDLVVVGHAQATRIPIVEALRGVCSVGVFGEGWGGGVRPVNGIEHVRAINSGRMYLSFARTAAGFTNVKVGVFEAAACRTCLVTDHFEEMERYFRYGLEVVGCTGLDELLRAVDYFVSNERQRDWLAQNSYDRFLRDHTWTRRWESVLRDARGDVA